MLGIYNIALQFYKKGIQFASFFQTKASQWIEGRKEVFQTLERSEVGAEKNLVWIHAASLGEFEQGRPIIEQIKQVYPDCKILLSFFSPSGYEIRKNYPLADYVTYLPLDTQKNAKRFIEITKPKLVIFIKYELWYHYFNELQNAGIPTLLVSALFREKQFFFKSYGQWFKKVIKGLDHIFVQNKNAEQVLLKNGISNVSIVGDTRVDRVAKLASQQKSFSIIREFVGDRPALILGSTWPLDEEILNSYINSYPQKWRYIIAPHDIAESRVEHIEHTFLPSKIRYSKAEGVDLKNYDMLIIDNIGMLAALYQYGKVAYIGGALGKGLHNTLEPIAFGLPVVFGTKFQKFEEANWLVENGGGFSIHSSDSLHKIFNQLEEDTFYNKASEKAKEYIQKNQGATEEILKFIKKKGYLN